MEKDSLEQSPSRQSELQTLFYDEKAKDEVLSEMSWPVMFMLQINNGTQMGLADLKFKHNIT